jgi:hypothetical protein
MTKDTPEVAAARIEAERARARLMETARELQERLSPGALAQNAWEGAKSKGADLAEGAVDAVRRRPAIASGVVAAIALFLAREPLIDMAGKLADGVSGKSKPKKGKAAPRKARSKEKKTETIDDSPE